ncbi:RNA polymerase sigma factor RpoD/SigA [Flavobacteriales bacterium]|nr:RNA polymerase sigma factor RpoD/SigA [Flavobacteriales bacterium]
MKQLIITRSTTDRSDASLNLYLAEISRIPMITAQEEAELACLIQEGDKQALDRLVKANLRFVVSVAKKYQHIGLPLVDLVNEGNLGLMKAAQKFDHTKGFKFISYAVWWIRQSILDAVAKTGRLVRLPSNQVDTLLKVRSAMSDLEQLLEREPEEHEISEHLDVALTVICQSRKNELKPKSIDAPVGEGDPGSASLGDLMVNTEVESPDAPLTRGDLTLEISRALSALTVREADVLRLCFGLNGHAMSLEEISQKLEVTRERVRQIRDKGVRQMSSHLDLDEMRVYLN